jgi:glucose/arabinose dehydrogenase
MKKLTLLFLVFIATFCFSESRVDLLKVPAGFKIELFAKGISNARTMVLGEQGTIFIGTRSADKVYAIKNSKVYVIAKNLRMPNGLAFHKGALYIAAVDRILRLDNIENNLANPPQAVVVRNNLPRATHHGWRFIAFGPDNRLYIAIGAPCNVCLKQGFAEIRSMKADGTDEKVVATGIRNSVGFTWHPQTKKIWLSDNGRDMLGDDIPADEINRVDKSGQDFGFPYCHGGTVADPDYNEIPCDKFSPPAVKLGAHVTPLGITFYTGNKFPKKYQNQLFVAEHGSWNRSQKSGYRIGMVKLKNSKVIGYETFVSGWLQGQSAWGRPAYTLIMPDGSMLISDDRAGAIYRVSYTGKN